MTAYVKNANGAWNVSTLWTPNGTPGSADTVTLGAFTTSIPNGYTAQCGGITSMAGSDTSTRSTLEISGTLEMYGTANMGLWSTLSFIGAGKIDLRGNAWEISYADGSGKRAEVISDGAGLCEIYSSTTIGHFGGPTAGQGYGKLALTNFRIANTSFQYGSTWYPGNGYKLVNGLFYDCGRIENDGYVDDADEWIVQNVMYVDSQAAEDQKVWLHCRDKGGTITGTRTMQNVIFDYRGISNASVRMRYFPAALTPTGIYLAGCYLEGLTIASSFTNLFSNGGVVGEGGFPISDSYFSPYVNNPHTMINLVSSITTSIIESNQPSGSTDAGDHFIVTTSGTNSITYSLIIDNYGAVCLNALGVPEKTGTYTMDHCTYVCDQQDAGYGKAARNENSGTFAASSTVTVKNSIFHNRSNPSGSTTGRVFFMETAGNDQIEYVDYNVININSSTLSNIYWGVTYSSGGAIGTQTGRALHDMIGVDPGFVDQNRGILSWSGQATYDSAVSYLLNGILGYNPSTNRLSSGLVTGNDVNDLIDYVWAGFVSTNPLLLNAGSDSLTIGAAGYQAAASTGALTSIGISFSGLSASGISS